MKRFMIACALMLSSALLSGCSLFGPLTVANGPTPLSVPDSGVGGTGFRGGDEDHGVGGTGISHGMASLGGDEDEGVGGTGIFGVISAFGSIIVNGVHIDFEPETKVSVDGADGSSADFALGQTVSVEAVPVGERYRARLVDIQHAVVGPVSEVDQASRSFTVLGQHILVPEGERLPVMHEWVKVSGLRDADNRIEANRIDFIPDTEEVLVRGIVESGNDGLRLSRLPLGGEVRDLSAGDEVLVRGAIEANGLAVRRFAKAPPVPFAGRMNDLLIDGAVRRLPDGSVFVAGHNWRLPDRVRTAGEHTAHGDLHGRYVMRGVWSADRLALDPRREEGTRAPGSDVPARSDFHIERDDPAQIETRPSRNPIERPDVFRRSAPPVRIERGAPARTGRFYQ